MKLFVDGKASQNLLVMHSLDGQGDDRNFFKHALTNDLPASQSFVVAGVEAALRIAGYELRYLPLDSLAKVSPDGTIIEQAMAPRQIWLTPTDNHGFTDISASCAKSYGAGKPRSKPSRAPRSAGD